MMLPTKELSVMSEKPIIPSMPIFSLKVVIVKIQLEFNKDILNYAFQKKAFTPGSKG